MNDTVKLVHEDWRGKRPPRLHGSTMTAEWHGSVDDDWAMDRARGASYQSNSVYSVWRGTTMLARFRAGEPWKEGER